MREKYIEERFSRWFIFGRHLDTGRVDLSGSDCDVFENIPEEVAEKLIAVRNAYVDALVAVFMEHPDALFNLAQQVSR